MSRIATRFAALQAQGRKALVPYLTAGDPSPAHTVALMHALVGAGADIIELGVPFSDPMADGPVIQQAAERALIHGVSLKDVIAMVKEFRAQDRDTPVVLMGYLNPVEHMGYARFAAQAGDAGVDGVLTVDLPPEEAGDLTTVLARYDIDPIFLFAPTTAATRMVQLAAVARGFVYYVALRGVTGAKNLDFGEVERKIDLIRTQTRLPIGVGFGIDGPAAAARVARFADAIIVGTAVVKRVAALGAEPQRIAPELAGFIQSLRQAIDGTDGTDGIGGGVRAAGAER